MRIRIGGLALLAPLFACAPVEGPAADKLAVQGMDCSAVASFAIDDVTIDTAEAVDSGLAWAAGMPPTPFGRTPVGRPFCRVQGRIEQDIRFELWLPRKVEWNGKFLGAGVGGAAGTFNFQDLPRGVTRGYAAATTDTGHDMMDDAWMMDPRARENYTHRANHLLAIKSKEIVAQFYGDRADYSYFVGCSGGGRQGLKELQLFPADYDGILTGANGPKTPEMTVRRMWEILQRDAHPDLMSRDDWQLVADAGTRACDMTDGVEDGLVRDPRSCKFEVASLQCKPGQTSGCLSAEQVEFAASFYAPLRDAQGNAIDDGLLSGVLVDSGRSRLAPATFGQAVRGLAEWNGEEFAVGPDLAGIDRVMPELRADNPDVSAFRDRGGKVIQYAGWLDGAVAARMVVNYHEALVQRAGGEAAAAKFARLYMLPGVYHCGGGPGPDRIGGAGSDGVTTDAQNDLLTALELWVEQGIAPGEMIASKVEQIKVTRTGLICPWPKKARYRSGDPARASSFECG